MEAETLRPDEFTLLFVDDEPLMREVFEKLMVKHGFRILTASSGQQALNKLEQGEGSVHLVLTDMTMPAMDGLALTTELGTRYPNLPVMLATGHDVDAETARAYQNVVAVVRKPYQHRVLAVQIRDLLIARRQTS